MPLVPGSPYDPVPTTAPAERPLRVFGVPDVPDAFGAGVARAVSAFGGDVEQAGGEVFNRALALKQMQIEGGVRDYATDWGNRMEGVKNAFTAKQGHAAGPDAMNATLAQIDQERQATRAEIVRKWGDYGGKLFDDQTAMMSRSFTREIGGHGQTQLQQAQKTSIANANAAGGNAVSSSPWSEQVWKAEVDARKRREETDGSLRNLPRDEIDFNKKTAVSDLAKNRVIAAAMADTQGTGAAFDVFQRLKDSGDLSDPSDIQNAEKTVRARFDAGSNAAILSKTQDLLDEYRTFGSETPRAKRLQGEIDQLQQRRVVLGETQEVADLANKERQEKVGAAQTEFKVNAELRGTSLFQPMIDQAAARHGINPILLARQLHQESSLDPNVAASSAGAQGIAQFMPDTAKQYGVDVRSPASSIEGAAHYMEDLTRQFNGNTGLALAAYNWGPGNLAAWIAGGSKPAGMPAETKNYVKNITGQSVADWIAGERPDIAALQAPPAAAGSVQRALAVVNQARTDTSVSATQRSLNATAGENAIKKWQEDNIRLANVNEVKQKQIDDKFESDILTDSTKEQPQWTETTIKQLPDETQGGPSAAAKQRMIRFLATDGLPGPPSRVSNANAIDFYRRINLPDGDPQKISRRGELIDAASNGLLNRTDLDWVLKKFDEPTTPEGERLSRIRNDLSKAVSADLEKSMLGNIDQSGKLQAYKWERDLDAAMDQRRKDKEDPMDLLDPSKPEFFASEAKLKQYRVPFEQVIKNVQDRISGGGALPIPNAPTITAAPGIPGVTPAFGAPAPSPQAPAVAPRRPGESAMEYMQRTAPPVLGPGRT